MLRSKVSGMKLCLPKQKCTKNESLIFFFLILCVQYVSRLKVYLPKRNEQRMKCSFLWNIMCNKKSSLKPNILNKELTKNETLISLKYKVYCKRTNPEAVFRKREMNNESKVHFIPCIFKEMNLWFIVHFSLAKYSYGLDFFYFFWNTKHIVKEPSLKLYFARKKWTMNERFISWK